MDAITLNSTWELEFKICNSTDPDFKVNYGEVPMILLEQSHISFRSSRNLQESNALNNLQIKV